MILRYLAGPLIGSVIGYFTNYIAVKMLFFPRHEVKLFGHVLPFTPGAIPKGKPRLAKAIGEVVGKTLLTREDIEKQILSEEVLTPVTALITEKLGGQIRETIVQTAALSEEQYISGKEKIINVLSDEIANALSQIDLTDFIAEKGSAAIKEKVQGTMLAMFLSDELIRSVTTPIAADIQASLAKDGAGYIKPYLAEKLDELEQCTSLDVLAKLDISEEDTGDAVSAIFQNMLVPSVGTMVDALNISGIVERKIDEMSVVELEKLVLTVMKKELNMIVNLGAVIGFVLGLINLCF